MILGPEKCGGNTLGLGQGGVPGREHAAAGQHAKALACLSLSSLRLACIFQWS